MAPLVARYPNLVSERPSGDNRHGLRIIRRGQKERKARVSLQRAREAIEDELVLELPIFWTISIVNVDVRLWNSPLR